MFEIGSKITNQNKQASTDEEIKKVLSAEMAKLFVKVCLFGLFIASISAAKSGVLQHIGSGKCVEADISLMESHDEDNDDKHVHDGPMSFMKELKAHVDLSHECRQEEKFTLTNEGILLQTSSQHCVAPLGIDDNKHMLLMLHDGKLCKDKDLVSFHMNVAGNLLHRKTKLCVEVAADGSSLILGTNCKDLFKFI